MIKKSVEEQIRLLDEKITTRFWGVMPGTKSRKRFVDELRHSKVILMRHRNGEDLVRVAHRACARVYCHLPEGRLRLQTLAVQYPGNYVQVYDPNKKTKWSITETRGRKRSRRGAEDEFERLLQTIIRGVGEEVRAEKSFPFSLEAFNAKAALHDKTYEAVQCAIREGIPAEKDFKVKLKESQIEQISPNETYEEHISHTYPGILTGNFDTQFIVFFEEHQFRPIYFASDHGKRIAAGWVRD